MHDLDKFGSSYIINQHAKQLVLPQLTKYLSKGFPLPIIGVHIEISHCVQDNGNTLNCYLHTYKYKQHIMYCEISLFIYLIHVNIQNMQATNY